MQDILNKLLNDNFPFFKDYIKNQESIDTLLRDFCFFCFPEETTDNLKYILGAFVLAPKIKTLNIDGLVLEQVNNVYNTLSKYSHQNLQKIYSSYGVKRVFDYFFEYGIDHFRNEQMVSKNIDLYSTALNNIQSNFELQKYKLHTSN